MTAVVAVMSSNISHTKLPKRHGFSIESLIGGTDSNRKSPPLSPTTNQARPAMSSYPAAQFPSPLHSHTSSRRSAVETPSPPSRPVPIRPTSNRDTFREREIEFKKETLRNIEREHKERNLFSESLRERGLRDLRELAESRDALSASPPSPREDKSVSPEMENRLNALSGEDFKHLLGNFNSSSDTSGLFQSLRMCNRAALASINGMPTGAAHPASLVGIPPQLAHLQVNPFLFNIPADLRQPSHPLLAPRYPGLIPHRFPNTFGGPPFMFHPYRKPKRNRTAFSPSQLLQLEQAFEKNHYVVGQERKTLAAKLQLTETQVKVWFQNRRTKHKRMKAEEDTGGSRVADDSTDLTTYEEHDEEIACSSEEEEEELLSVTEDL